MDLVLAPDGCAGFDEARDPALAIDDRFPAASRERLVAGKRESLPRLEAFCAAGPSPI